jgi:hypothetical protein
MRQKLYFALGCLVLIIAAGSCTVTPPPKAVLSNLSPNPLVLPTVRVPNTTRGEFSFSNTGDATLTYTIDFDKPESGSLAPGQSTTFELGFKCEEAGDFGGDLLITSNGGNATLKVEFTCLEPLPTDGNFNIDLRFIGDTTTDEQKAAFEQAELTWEAVITSDLVDTQWDSFDQSLLNNKNRCDPAAPNIVGETIDDVVIFAKVGPIDGGGNAIDGNTLAFAGPLAIRQFGTFIPYGGCMVFDEFDLPGLVAEGSFADVVLHEMGHVLGIGTIWDLNDLYGSPCSIGGGDVPYIGSNAQREFNELGGFGNPLAEGSTNTQGTDCGHWDEGTLDNELMTGKKESGGTRLPLSSLTLGGLEDIGYEVDYNLAASYDLPADCSPNCTIIETQTGKERWEIVLQPAIRPEAKTLKLFSKKQ